MGLQSVIRWLIPREDHFFDYVEAQAVVAEEFLTTVPAQTRPEQVAAQAVVQFLFSLTKIVDGVKSS